MVIFFVVTAVLLCAAIVAINIYRDKRKNFVRENSVALRQLAQINAKHTFLPVKHFAMSQKYDNRHYYDSISPGDYLTYQLLYKHKEVARAIHNAEENAEHIKIYRAEVASNCVLGKFKSTEPAAEISAIEKWLRKIWLTRGFAAVCKVEKKLFDGMLAKPITEFQIPVTLHLTKINGRMLTYKSAVFRAPEILETIKRIKSKDNGRFEDPNLWQAITRVERGKVSNRMRFAVYKRDGNRCRKCGSRWNLEVDHIYPISKGGKTTFDNLQTLCHNCNAQKSNFIEPPAVPLRSAYRSYENLCPNCGIPLVKRRGNNGSFWGCPNYPRCRFTKNITR